MFPSSSDKTAIIQNDLSFTYRELILNIQKFSSLIDISKDDKVAIISENRYEWIFILYATWNKFGIFVPIDYLSIENEIAFILNDCKPKYIFYTNKTQKQFLEAINKVNYQPNYLNIDNLNFDDIKNLSEINFDKINLNDTALIPYTSGTTGNPKGVMLSFNNLIANINAVSKEVPIYSSDDRVIAILPFHHILPLQGTITITLSLGATLVIATELSSEYILSQLQKHKITIMIGVPRLYKLFYNGIKSKIDQNFVAKLLFNISKLFGSDKVGKIIFKSVQNKFGGKLKYCVSGGAKLELDVAKGMRALGFSILEGYGMTEAAPMIAFTHPNKIKPGSAGFIMKCMDYKILDDGELCVKGPNVMKGYYNSPDATNDIIKDGWLHTGDIAKIDKKGFIYIEGRSKDIIVMPNGKKFNPETIEFEIMKNYPIIKEIGLSLYKDQLTAIIFPDEKVVNSIGIVDVRDYIKWNVIDKFNKTVADYKRITNFFVVNNELPKTRLGKIRRFALTELMQNTSQKIASNDIDIPGNIEYKILNDYLKNVVKKNILPDEHFEFDLGLDSLAKVELIAKIESSFGIKLSEHHLSEHSTLRKLSDFISDKKTKIENEITNWNKLLTERRIHKLPKNTFLLKILKHLSKPLFKIYFQLEIVGKDKLPKNNFIIAPNHQSFLDGLLIACALNDNILSKSYFFAKDKYINNFFVKIFARFSNIVSLNINADLKESIQKMGYILQQNKNIIIFPEGTRTRDGNINEFKKSFAILSKELNVPIVPVTISGAYEALSIGSKLPKPKKIKLHFLEPVYPENKTYDQITDEVKSKIYKCLTSNC